MCRNCGTRIYSGTSGQRAMAMAMAFAVALPLGHSGSARHLIRSTSKRPRVALSRACTPRAQTGYIPDEDDRADASSDVPTQLTLPQQLLMKQYEEQVARMSPKECRELALEIARQMMVKDNILRKMLKTEVDFGIEPPDPDDFQSPETAV